MSGNTNYRVEVSVPERVSNLFIVQMDEFGIAGEKLIFDANIFDRNRRCYDFAFYFPREGGRKDELLDMFVRNGLLCWCTPVMKAAC
jgi:hypothetical protein